MSFQEYLNNNRDMVPAWLALERHQLITFVAGGRWNAVPAAGPAGRHRLTQDIVTQLDQKYCDDYTATSDWILAIKKDRLAALRDSCEGGKSLAALLLAREREEASEDEVCLVTESYIMGRLLGNGMHVLCPDAATLEALENFDIPLTAAEYHQPYPTLVIEVPAGYERVVADLVTVGPRGQRHSRPTAARFVVLDWHPAERLILHATVVSPAAPAVAEVINLGDRTIAAALALDVDSHPTRIDAARLLRAACNLALLATQARLRDLPGSENHRDRVARRLEKARRRGDAGLVATNEIELATIPYRHAVTQDLPLVRVTHSTDADAPRDATGRLMPPHWRRGHWRRQRVGAGRQETRLVAIPAVLVNADLLTGDRAATLTRMT